MTTAASTLLRAIVADDEEPARRRLSRLLAGEGVDVVGAAADGRATIAMAHALKPDVLFVDIAMPLGSGLDVAVALPQPEPHVVFVTAHPDFAAQAFELAAFDYILKPVSTDRVGKVLARVRAARAVAPSAAAPASRIERLGSKLRGRIEFMDVADIDWGEAEGNYVTLHSGTRRLTVRQTMVELVRQLDSGRFQRVHRSFIVQVDRIVRLEPHLRGDWTAILRDGTLITVSRSYRRAVLTALGVPDDREAVSRRFVR